MGDGPFPTQLSDDVGKKIRDNGKEYGSTTGRPRRCGWLDVVLLKYACQLNHVTELAMMKLDVLSKLQSLRVCVGYELDGQPLTHVPTHCLELERAIPKYWEGEGWSEDLGSLTKVNQLPKVAREYIDNIEEWVGVPITIVSVGPDRSQTLTRKSSKIFSSQ